MSRDTRELNCDEPARVQPDVSAWKAGPNLCPLSPLKGV